MAKHLKVELPTEGYQRRLIACQQACPVNTDARSYVRYIAQGRFEEAYLIARGPNPFASICGRVCAAPCESACRRGRIPITDSAGRWLGSDEPIAIRALKRAACERSGVEAGPLWEVWEKARAFTSDACGHAEELAALLRALVEGRFEKAKGERIAIIGAGPAGLSAAHDLALMGFKPVVFETEPIPAGMLIFGIPEYRLPHALIEREVALIQELGVEIRCNMTVGKDITLAELRKDFDAVIMAIGAKNSRALGLPGERGPGVFGGVDFLRAVVLNEPVEIGSKVLVIGGGNVAYDVARTVVRQAAMDAARLAARMPTTRAVTLASLETLEEMPADTVEIKEGDEEGVTRLNGWGPLEVLRDAEGGVKGVTFRRCLRVYDEERRFSPQYDDDDVRTVECDTVMMAVGQSTDLSLLEDGGDDIEQPRQGWPKVDPDTLMTTGEGVFAAGDLAHGTRLLIDAVASGKKAARSVYAHLTGRKIHAETLQTELPLEAYERERGYISLRRVEMPTTQANERLADRRQEVESGYTEEQASLEASRCLDCGVTPVVDSSRCVLCGGCSDVCPTRCLKLISLDQIAADPKLEADLAELCGEGEDLSTHSAIIKDEDRCIRCGQCAMRCPADAIDMELVQFTTDWSIK